MPQQVIDERRTPSNTSLARLLLACFLGMVTGVTSFPMYLLGAFAPYYNAEFGWTAHQVGLGSTCLGAGILCASPIVGILVDRTPARRIALPSLIALSLLMLSLSMLSGEIWRLYATYFCMGFLGCGAGPIAYSRIVTTYFTTRRGLALGVALAGAGLGSAFGPLLVSATAPEFGWRATWRIMALLNASPLLILYFVLPKAQAPNGATQALAQATANVDQSLRRIARVLFGRREGWLLFATTACFAIFVPQLIVLMIPALRESGYSATEVGAMASLYGVAMIVGRVAVGYVVDRAFAPWIGALLFGLSGLGCIAFALWGKAAALPMIMLLGLVTAAEIDLMSYLAGKYFDTRIFGRIYGAVTLWYMVLGLFAPVVAGILLDLDGFSSFYKIAGLTYCFGGLLFLMFKRYPIACALPADDAGEAVGQSVA